ncbi:O-antigen ligase family protein [Maribacter halichondriae]|uniref:O-antigen ligase family protein n=1 Tax=Maribacter halichondriae TaxID=2980554 RepID=UPI0023587FA7|nr:O-antigen ligase family protein [Maribacter sp. Hal144]
MTKLKTTPLSDAPKGNLFLGILIIITIMFLLAFGPYFNLEKVTTFVLLPILFVISLFIELPKTKGNKRELLVLTLILVLSLFSVFNYIDYELLMQGYSGLAGAVVAAYIPLALNKKKNYFFYFHVGYIIAIVILIYIMYIEKDFTFSNFASSSGDRDRFLLNANSYSYYSFFANFSLFYLHQRYRNALLVALLVVLPVLFLIVGFVTQSRSALLLIVASNICYWFFIHKVESKNIFIKPARFLMVVGAFYIMATQFIAIYEESNIKDRVDSSVSKKESREILVEESIDAFLQNPMLGVGLGQVRFYTSARQFSHNSYVEILAEQGIFGGVLLFFLFVIPFRNAWSMWKKDKRNRIIKINILFLLMFYVYNNFYPFYKFSFSTLYFFMVISMNYRVMAQFAQKRVEPISNKEPILES